MPWGSPVLGDLIVMMCTTSSLRHFVLVTEGGVIHQLGCSKALLWSEWTALICSLTTVCSFGSQGRRGGSVPSMEGL